MKNCRRRDARAIAGLAIPLLLWSAAVGRTQTVDPALWKTNGDVSAVVRDGGTIYIGGSFTQVGPTTGAGAVFDAGTGSAQLPYQMVGVGLGATNAIINAVAPDGSGGWYLGGSFTIVRG